MTTPRQLVADMKAYIVALRNAPAPDPEAATDKTGDCRHAETCHRYDAMNDWNVCIECERDRLANLQDAVAHYPDASDEDICERCGQVGYKDEDMQCRSPECTSGRAQYLMDTMEDR